MASYPSAIYSPRTRENRSGVVYDATKKTVIYVEDNNKSDDEVIAIETELGTLPKGSDADVKTRLDRIDSQVNFSAAPAADAVSGIKITLAAAVNVALGDVCYIDSNGKAALGDADAIASASVLVMATASISQNDSGVFLVLGTAHLHTLAPGWTVGGLIYLSTTGSTGNTLTQTAPTGTDDVIQILGVALAADIILFKPSLVQIEHT